MQILTVFSFPKNNYWYWGWRDEFTNKIKDSFPTQKEALEKKPINSRGYIYIYDIIFP